MSKSTDSCGCTDTKACANHVQPQHTDAAGILGVVRRDAAPYDPEMFHTEPVDARPARRWGRRHHPLV